MVIDAMFVAVAGAVFNGFLIAFSVGVVWGKLGTRIAKNSEDIATLKEQFINGDGEPRLLSYKAHDHICRLITGNMVTEFKHVVEALKNLTAETKDMRDQMGEMTVAIAVLEGEREE